MLDIMTRGRVEVVWHWLSAIRIPAFWGDLAENRAMFEKLSNSSRHY